MVAAVHSKPLRAHGLETALVLTAAITSVSISQANNYSWNAPVNAFFDSAASWTPNGVPGGNDSATLFANGTYDLFLETSPTIEDLNVSVGNVTLYNFLGIPRTVNVNSRPFNGIQSTYSGTQTVSLTNANGNTSLTLGLGTPVFLNTNNLSVQGGAALVAQYGSQITVGTHFDVYDVAQGVTDPFAALHVPPSFGSTINGLVIAGGSGAMLSIGATYSSYVVIDNLGNAVYQGDYQYLINQSVGTSGGTGELLFESGSTGSSMAGKLSVADDGTSANGSVVLVSGSTFEVKGNISLATDGSNGIPTALLEINSANSFLTQSADPFGDPTELLVGSGGHGSATVNVSTSVSGGTLIAGTGGLTIYKTGSVNVGSGTTTGTLNANGNVFVVGGALYVGPGSAFNLAPGMALIIDDGGTADFKSYTPNASQLIFTAGSLSYAGNLLVGTGGLFGDNDLTLDSKRRLSPSLTTTIDPKRTLTLSGGALSTDSLVNNGTLDLQSGTLNTVTATLAGGSTLKFTLSGKTPSTDYCTLAATGSVSFAGSLMVTLNNFTPMIGDTFNLLDGTLSGVFPLPTLPGLPGGEAWDSSHLFTTGVLSVVAATGVPGDYNGNGIVDAADYTVWRDHLGQTFALANRSSANTGPISTADYDVWKSNFGNHSGSGARANAAVPEPTTRILFIVGGTVVGFLIRRSRVIRDIGLSARTGHGWNASRNTSVANRPIFPVTY